LNVSGSQREHETFIWIEDVNYRNKLNAQILLL